MAWDVEFTDEFETWWNSLSVGEQIEIDAKAHLLEQFGPVLPRPHADVITQSRHANMKELRGRVPEPGVAPHELRVLYAFDPNRTALLLIGATRRVILVVRPICADRGRSFRRAFEANRAANMRKGSRGWQRSSAH